MNLYTMLLHMDWAEAFHPTIHVNNYLSIFVKLLNMYTAANNELKNENYDQCFNLKKPILIPPNNTLP